MGLDYKIWLVMAILCLLSLGVFGYKSIREDATGSKSCANADIIMVDRKDSGILMCNSKQFNSFSVAGIASSNITWNFGDGTPIEKGAVVSHAFTAAGGYTVTATINNACEIERLVMVKTSLVLPPEKLQIEIYPYPLNPKAGDSVTLYAVINKPVTSYKWSIGSGVPDIQTTPEATFHAPLKGGYNVQLVINNEPTAVKLKTIKVAASAGTLADLGNGPPPAILGGGSSAPTEFPTTESLPNLGGSTTGGAKPPAPVTTDKPAADTVKAAPAKPEPKEIHPDEFKGLLQEVLEEKQSLEMLYPYLFYKESTRVEVNGKQPQITLANFVKEYKKRKIKRLELQPEKDKPKMLQVIKVQLKGTVLGIRL